MFTLLYRYIIVELLHAEGELAETKKIGNLSI